MKVTVIPKETKENIGIPFDEIPVGYVYVAGHYGGVIALKLNGGEAMLLNYYMDGGNFLEIAKGYKGISAYKILGELTEIIIKEE